MSQDPLGRPGTVLGGSGTKEFGLGQVPELAQQSGLEDTTTAKELFTALAEVDNQLTTTASCQT